MTLRRPPGGPGRDFRLLRAMTLVNSIGTGLYLSAGAIFLTRSAGLTAGEVGIGLTVAGLAGIAAGVLVGDQADRHGAREVVIVTLLFETLAAVALLAVHSLLLLVPVATLAAMGSAGSTSARGALIGLMSGPDGGARLRSYLRAVTNIGLAIGTLGAGVVLAFDSRPAYVAMILGNALTFTCAAVLVARLPRLAPTRTAESHAEDHHRFLALRDRRYLAMTAATSVASLQYDVLIVALPLWLTLHTDVPSWSPAAMFLMASLLVAALQVPATRSIDGPRSAARLVALSGPVFLVSWVLVALASGLAAGPAFALVAVGVVLHSLAEVWQAAGTFELSFALARPEAQGQYQGVFGLSTGLAEAVAPALLVALCITWGQPGWIVLGVAVTLAGLACAWIERRPATSVPADARSVVGVE